MVIEFHAPEGLVSDRLIRKLRRQLVDLWHQNQHISRAEVSFRKDSQPEEWPDKVCEIRLTIYGGSLLSHAREIDFETASARVLDDLRDLVQEQLNKEGSEPPDMDTSTVDTR